MKKGPAVARESCRPTPRRHNSDRRMWAQKPENCAQSQAAQGCHPSYANPGVAPSGQDYTCRRTSRQRADNSLKMKRAGGAAGTQAAAMERGEALDRRRAATAKSMEGGHPAGLHPRQPDAVVATRRGIGFPVEVEHRSGAPDGVTRIYPRAPATARSMRGCPLSRSCEWASSSWRRRPRSLRQVHPARRAGRSRRPSAGTSSSRASACWARCPTARRGIRRRELSLAVRRGHVAFGLRRAADGRGRDRRASTSPSVHGMNDLARRSQQLRRHAPAVCIARTMCCSRASSARRAVRRARPATDF